ncbi:hypothetical protein [Pseudolactococcus reticulitermitis]|uniref:Uncharacterized protein n=1 Tax=Pseudolactococcus reticulitermitis TaxID=2025039 RepID=A0A224WZB5_9LACT|nr:hypothetical protein [Lactococcus reticulitermitis]GAX47418.1 hypothetical protein RsY01_1018 [Lactococcus reticulitermitis]
MTAKQLALRGNIFGTIGGIFLLRDSIANLIAAKSLVAEGYTEKSFLLIYMTGLIIGMLVLTVVQVLTWIAYTKIGKSTERRWQLFLLIIGILLIIEALFGLMLTVLTAGFLSALLGNLLHIIQSIFFILTFALKDKNVARN